MAVPVETITTSGDVSRDVKELVQRLGGIRHFVQPGERVLIKPACNSPYAFPATTDLGVIATMVELNFRGFLLGRLLALGLPPPRHWKDALPDCLS